MRKLHQILTDGGAGDLLCQLVAVNYNIKNNPEIDFQVWVPDYLCKFAMHVLPPKTAVFPFSDAEKKFDKAGKGRTTQWFDHGHTPMRTHPVDYGFHMLADKHITGMADKSYLKIRPGVIDIKKYLLPEKYVCIATTAAEPVKALSPSVLNEIIDYVISKGYTPVFLGKEESDCGFKDFKVKSKVIPIDYSKGINLLNKTTLLEAARVIHGAAVYIGMDSGLTHLAGFTDTYIVAGYTLVDPRHVAPIRKGFQNYRFYAIEPDETVPNRYFQTNNSFYEGDYRTFPGWEAVIANLTADKFIAKLSLIL